MNIPCKKRSKKELCYWCKTVYSSDNALKPFAQCHCRDHFSCIDCIKQDPSKHTFPSPSSCPNCHLVLSQKFYTIEKTCAISSCKIKRDTYVWCCPHSRNCKFIACLNCVAKQPLHISSSHNSSPSLSAANPNAIPHPHSIPPSSNIANPSSSSSVSGMLPPMASQYGP